MRRPGPLLELPLEVFLPPDSNILQISTRPGKRPLSPGVSRLLSPAKRRVLNEEGLLLSDRASSLLSSTFKQPQTGRFEDVLNGPGSPAKVLDFGLPKNRSAMHREATAAMEVTPRRPVTRSMSKLAPPPELNPKPSSSRHEELTMSDSTFDARPPSYNARSPIYVPRDLPPPLDPQSIHYPGFEVYRDPYTVIFPTLGITQPEILKDEVKENLPCRRKSRKTMSISDKAELHLRSPSVEPAKRDSVYKPTSPKKIFGMYATVTTPHRLEMTSLHVSSPVKTGSKNFETIKRERKMKMMEEVDQVRSDIDDDADIQMLH
ncbi:hypothetical protein APHAL10511_001729 [Amanita phalloides]|nr:hypothetical protein APHAL10511_001729 [Amanita phalloides]